jgi:hypothetical protein
LLCRHRVSCQNFVSWPPVFRESDDRREDPAASHGDARQQQDCRADSGPPLGQARCATLPAAARRDDHRLLPPTPQFRPRDRRSTRCRSRSIDAKRSRGALAIARLMARVEPGRKLGPPFAARWAAAR